MKKFFDFWIEKVYCPQFFREMTIRLNHMKCLIFSHLWCTKMSMSYDSIKRHVLQGEEKWSIDEQLFVNLNKHWLVRVAQFGEYICIAGDSSSIPGSGRSPGEGNGNPLHYSCLGNPKDGGTRWATVHGVTKELHRT